MRQVINFIEKIKMWWLLLALIIVAVISSNIFDADIKTCKGMEAWKDSIMKTHDSIIAVRDGVIVKYNTVLGERDALSKQLDRNASQQIIINNKTTNITRKYIVKDTIKH